MTDLVSYLQHDENTMWLLRMGAIGYAGYQAARQIYSDYTGEEYLDEYSPLDPPSIQLPRFERKLFGRTQTGLGGGNDRIFTAAYPCTIVSLEATVSICVEGSLGGTPDWVFTYAFGEDEVDIMVPTIGNNSWFMPEQNLLAWEQGCSDIVANRVTRCRVRWEGEKELKIGDKIDFGYNENNVTVWLVTHHESIVLKYS